MYNKEDVLKIVDSCFNLFAPDYRSDAKDIATQIMIGMDKRNQSNNKIVPLTKKEIETRDFVINYISEFGKPPTYQIIADEFGIARNTAFYRMKYFRNLMK
jgi:hypothetical protein